MSLLRRERRVADIAAALYPLRSSRFGVGSVDADRAMRISAVWGCVRTLTEPIAGFPLDTFRKTPGIRKALDPGPSWITDPSALVTRRTWDYQAMVSMLLRGNCYGLHTSFDANGWPLKTEIVHPDSMQVTQKTQLDPPVYKLGGRIIPNDQIMHISAFNVPGSVVGMSPIAYAAATLGISLKAQEYGESFYNEGGHPTAALKTDQKIDDIQSKAVKQRFIEATRGSDRLAVLGSGWDFQAIQVSPAEAQFLTAMNASAIEICQFFGVPPEMLGVATAGSSVTYANREQRALDFVAFSLQWWLTRLEEVKTSLLPQQQFVKYNIDALLRSDATTRTAIQSQRVLNGLSTPDEERELDDRGPYPDGLGKIPNWPPKVWGQLATKDPYVVAPIVDPNAPAAPAVNPVAAVTGGK